MKFVMFVLILVLLGTTSALSQIPLQPHHILEVGSPIEQIAYSPDGSLLAVASHDGLYVCDTHAWNEPRLLMEGHILSVTFSPDGTLLASGGRDKVVHLWELQSGNQVELKGHEGSILSVRFSPDSQALVSGSWDGTVRFWNIEHKEEIGQLLLGTFGPAYSLAYRNDGSMLAIGGYNTIFLYNPERQQVLSTLHQQDEYGPELWILCVEFSPDGAMLVSGSGDNVVSLWNVTELRRTEMLRHNGNVHFVSFTPGGRQLAYGGWGRFIRIYDLVTQEFIWWESNWRISSGALSPDGRTLATAGADGIISFWEMPGPVIAVQSLSQKAIIWGMLKNQKRPSH